MKTSDLDKMVDFIVQPKTPGERILEATIGVGFIIGGLALADYVSPTVGEAEDKNSKVASTAIRAAMGVMVGTGGLLIGGSYIASSFQKEKIVIEGKKKKSVRKVA